MYSAYLMSRALLWLRIAADRACCMRRARCDGVLRIVLRCARYVCDVRVLCFRVCCAHRAPMSCRVSLFGALCCDVCVICV